MVVDDDDYLPATAVARRRNSSRRLSMAQDGMVPLPASAGIPQSDVGASGSCSLPRYSRYPKHQFGTGGSGGVSYLAGRSVDRRGTRCAVSVLASAATDEPVFGGAGRFHTSYPYCTCSAHFYVLVCDLSETSSLALLMFVEAARLIALHRQRCLQCLETQQRFPLSALRRRLPRTPWIRHSRIRLTLTHNISVRHGPT